VKKTVINAHACPRSGPHADEEGSCVDASRLTLPTLAFFFDTCGCLSGRAARGTYSLRSDSTVPHSIVESTLYTSRFAGFPSSRTHIAHGAQSCTRSGRRRICGNDGWSRSNREKKKVRWNLWSTMDVTYVPAECCAIYMLIPVADETRGPPTNANLSTLA
jgi:hypothetical protein